MCCYLTLKRPLVADNHKTKGHDDLRSQNPTSPELTRSNVEMKGGAGEEDEDDLAVHHSELSQRQDTLTPAPSDCFVLYSIIFSPSYRVPVLYFSIHRRQGPVLPLDMDAVFHSLVPDQERYRLGEFGVMGAVSVAVSNQFVDHSRRGYMQFEASPLIH